MIPTQAMAKEIGSYEIPLSIAVSPMNADNACLAAKYLDGVSVGPGEEFSFNDTVGMRTPSRGFTSGYIASPSRNEKAVGGGVCMTASILHQAVKSAGLEVLERHNHCIRISYLPMGEDAAVEYGVQDFRFRNSLNVPVTIHSTIGDTLRIAITTEDKIVQVFHNDQALQFETPPIIESNHLLVPIRNIAESMKGQLSWEPSSQEVRLIVGDSDIRLTIGSATAYVNGQEKQLEIAPRIINNRTMVALRFLGDELGEKISWDPIAQTVSLIDLPISGHDILPSKNITGIISTW